MKICIATNKSDFNSAISPIFGRAPYFLIADLENKNFKFVKNRATKFIRGAGIAAAQTVVSEKVKLVIVGNIGPRAKVVLEQSGIKVISNITGTVKEVLERFKKED